MWVTFQACDSFYLGEVPPASQSSAKALEYHLWGILRSLCRAAQFTKDQVLAQVPKERGDGPTLSVAQLCLRPFS